MGTEPEGRSGDAVRAIWLVLLPLCMWAVAAAALAWYVAVRPSGCTELSFRAPLSGGEAEFDLAVAECGSLSARSARTDLIAQGALFSLLVLALVPILLKLWRVSWRAEPFSAWRWVHFVPVAGGVMAAMATIVFALGSSTDDGSLTIGDGAARTVAALAWPASGLALLAVAAAGISALAAIGSNGVPLSDELSPGREWEPPDIDGVGVCVSGGGIRSAAFSMGSLAYLERHGADGSPATSTDRAVLDTARYLASVSGGGYTAGAWRVARGVAGDPATAGWTDGVFGDPTEITDPPRAAFDEASSTEGTPSLYRHAWARRQFLRTGRGGLSVSILRVLLMMLLQLGLIGLFVVVVSWPIGVLARSWAVLGPQWFEQDPYAFSPSRRSWTPVVAILVIAGVVALIRCVMLRSSRRLALDAGVAILVLLAAVLAAVLVLLPALVAAIANPAAFAAAAVAFASGGVAAFVWRIASSVLRPRLMRLGGVLFGLAAVAFGVVVIRAAAVPDGLLRGEIGQVPGGVVYALLAIVALVVWSFGDPRWWSLFPLYRDRIRSAFQVTTERDRSSARHPVSPGLYPLARRHEPTLDEYLAAPGPAHLVCCAAARENGTATGIPALSFVFGPDEVLLYESEPDRVVVHSVPTDRFVGSLRRRVFRGLGARRPKSLGTVAAAVAMSGAAVSSAMGRFDMGSTNTLIAGMNVRLGAWVPNPRYVVADDQPAKRARPNYLLKELKGWYDLADPHIYITDGGHWDNLGLVELLRRRCETIICVDASGDQPGSFSTFFDAIDLARTECAADIDMDGEEHGIAAMRVEGDDRRPATGTAVGTISYGEGGAEGTGTILYVKAQVSGDLPAALIGFSHEEPDFPDYSTADQFLTPEQFRQLVLLGWETTANGLGKLSGAGALGDGDDDADGDRADATIAGGSDSAP